MGVTRLTLALVAIVVVVAIGFTANQLNQARSPGTTQGQGQTSQTPNTSANGTGAEGVASKGPLYGLLYTRDVSCVLASGVCSLTIVNNSTTPVQLQSCELVGIETVGVTTTTRTVTSRPTTTFTLLPNGTTRTSTPTTSGTTTVTSTETDTVTQYGIVNGTVGGPATAGVPADSSAKANCTVPAASLWQQSQGSQNSGSFRAKMVDSAGGYAAGTIAIVSFAEKWS